MEHMVKFQPNSQIDVAQYCFHFGVITMVPVGYGDIAPKGRYAKLETDVQVLSGLALGILLGNWRERNLESDNTERFVNILSGIDKTEW